MTIDRDMLIQQLGSPTNAGKSSRHRPLKVGLVLPLIEEWMGGDTARWPDLLAMARRAEEVGFDSVWVVDHFMYQYPWDDDSEQPSGAWDGWSLLCALAAVTTQVEIGTLVACTAFRNPASLANMANTVDEISHGRLILGLGAGYYVRELHDFGYPADHLVSRFEEALAIITGLLKGETVDFAGTYYQAHECLLRLRGPRPKGPPILIGANGPRMMRLTARYADQWNEWICNTPHRAVEFRALLDAACHDVGRDPTTLTRTVAVTVDLPEFSEGSSVPWVREFRVRDEPPLTGSPEQIATALWALADVGVAHVQLYLEPNTLDGVEACALVLEALDRMLD